MMTNETMTAKLRNLKELKIMLDELNAEISAAEDEIKEEMKERGVEKLAIDVFKVSYTTVKSSRFDSKAFKVANPDTYKLFTKETTTRRFAVS